MIIIVADYFDQSVNDISLLLNDDEINVEILTTIQFLHKTKVDYNFGSHELNLRYRGSRISAIWFRRVSTWHNSRLDNSNPIVQYSTSEINTLTDFLYSPNIQTATIFLSSFRNSNLSKLTVLKTALECKLEIPESRIVTDLKGVNLDEYISKATYENLRFNHDGYVYMQYVDTLSTINLNLSHQKYLPSLIQERIDRMIEIRTCYFMGKFYSMGIHSTSHLDIRKNDYRKKRFPIKLPNDYIIKLKKLINL